ncbi:MAG: COX15/CtaA family protein [Rhodovarius sp.]|nr:COX15/CtaA family protein [Rhodovarius sp.]
MPFDASSTTLAPAERGDRTATRAIAFWLLAVAGMIWAMVALGGATRLTGSGLSIMEWAPISGILPPMSEAEWQRLYDLYRTIPQYQLVNAGFGMEGFRRIFWLEWLHRLWGRLIGLAYLLPFLWFWIRGQIPRPLLPRLLLLFLLGGLQGVIGWFMVASGFEEGRTEVSPYRLVLHLGMAFLLYGLVLWTALDLLRPTLPAAAGPAEARLRPWVKAAVWLAIATMLAGGFVAGIRAGFTYNSFPLMDGQWLPPGYFDLSPWWKNLTANIAAVQFNHRLLATLTLLGAAAAAVLAWRQLPPGRARGLVLALFAAVALQYGLGVLTLLYVVPVGLGTLHQAVAVLVLTMGLLALHGLRRPA